jgi:hypothetical protein
LLRCLLRVRITLIDCLPAIGNYAPKDYAEMDVIFMANEGSPNTAIVAWEYANKPGECHAFGLEALVSMKPGDEVIDCNRL